MPRRSFALASALLILATPALALPPGSYLLEGNNGEATVSDGTLDIAVWGSDECAGAVAGALSEDATGAWLMRAPDEGNSSCTVEVTALEDGFQFTESSCDSYHGATCGFSGVWKLAE